MFLFFARRAQPLLARGIGGPSNTMGRCGRGKRRGRAASAAASMLRSGDCDLKGRNRALAIASTITSLRAPREPGRAAEKGETPSRGPGHIRVRVGAAAWDLAGGRSIVPPRVCSKRLSNHCTVRYKLSRFSLHVCFCWLLALHSTHRSDRAIYRWTGPESAKSCSSRYRTAAERRTGRSGRPRPASSPPIRVWHARRWCAPWRQRGRPAPGRRPRRRCRRR